MKKKKEKKGFVNKSHSQFHDIVLIASLQQLDHERNIRPQGVRYATGFRTVSPTAQEAYICSALTG